MNPDPMNRAQTRPAAAGTTLLAVSGMTVDFPTPGGLLRALDDVHLDVPRGRTLAVVGESGSGKSVLARTVLRLLPPAARIADTASARFDGTDLMRLPQEAMRAMRGRRIGMVFQDPMTALNPVRRIGVQLEEALRVQLRMPADVARRRAIALLREVGIPAAERRVDQFPHELSGGMRQRVVIAMAIACEPDLLIADEPTTALDVTVQAAILELLRSLQQRRQMTMMLITHDLGVAAHHADEMAVMYAGQIVERGSVRALMRQPRMPYTAALLRAVPSLQAAAHARLDALPGRPPVMTVRQPGCHFAARCARRLDDCDRAVPPLAPPPGADLRPQTAVRAADPSGEVARLCRCWHPLEGA
ncbi:ABC transporter ATP-binding protein [Cupriavidus gilardii]|uniref:ABC transporter ATP-binding protein n=1 Tax=Cupriavidus gilardii TaxID=82541 RepID=UPI001ABDE500|nr:ABC transporter ATP-binding protein [Cupriavidus gilardii]MBO4120167.1 ABC transporter ATP-binding protein [Cupriavidus gilardii]